MEESFDPENPDWDAIIKMAKSEEKKGYTEYTCKKCGIKFISPRYAGKFPLCQKHRLKD